jgi:predicted dienelactone hydrolase
MRVLVSIILLLVAVVVGTAAVLLEMVVVAAVRRERARALVALRWLVGLVASVALVIGALVAYGSIQGRRPVTLPQPTGPYSVGRTMMDWTDAARVDPLAPQPREPRRLCVWLWYPATERRNVPRAPYRPGLGDQSPGFAASRNAVIRTHTVDDAPLSERRSSYPVLVFEPGLGADAAAYTALAEEFASQGYVVAAINDAYVREGAVFSPDALGHEYPEVTVETLGLRQTAP